MTMSGRISQSFTQDVKAAFYLVCSDHSDKQRFVLKYSFSTAFDFLGVLRASATSALCNEVP